MAKEVNYDIAVVGGGLAGSTLARVLAESGISVLVLEREKRFRDRVRGEALLPWGVPDARELGVYERLMTTCGREVRWANSYEDGSVGDRRDLVATTSHHSGFLTFQHPKMQTVLLAAAEAAGVVVRRGTKVVKAIPGEPATLVLQNGDRIRARLVVGADGRNSRARIWGGFEVKHDPEQIIVAGVLLEHMTLAEDAVHFVISPRIGQIVGVFPLGQQRFRCYFMTSRRSQYPALSGPRRLSQYIGACIETGAPQEWYKDAQIVGPLATFEGANIWVDDPSREGIVLIGDAAAVSDPTWGWGLASTLRDVRTLRDQLLATGPWQPGPMRGNMIVLSR